MVVVVVVVVVVMMVVVIVVVAVRKKTREKEACNIKLAFTEKKLIFSSRLRITSILRKVGLSLSFLLELEVGTQERWW